MPTVRSKRGAVHYHSSAHEILGIGRGHAALQIGG